jgi:hypothetical protein
VTTHSRQGSESALRFFGDRGRLMACPAANYIAPLQTANFRTQHDQLLKSARSDSRSRSCRFGSESRGGVGQHQSGGNWSKSRPKCTFEKFQQVEAAALTCHERERVLDRLHQRDTLVMLGLHVDDLVQSDAMFARTGAAHTGGTLNLLDARVEACARRQRRVRLDVVGQG